MSKAMWYVCASFEDEAQSKKVYFTLQDMLKQEAITASVFRIQVRGKSHVVIVGEALERVTPAKKARLMEGLSSGVITELPRYLLIQITERRKERLSSARYDHTKNALWNETHVPAIFETVPRDAVSDVEYVNIGNITTYTKTPIVTAPVVSSSFLASLRGKPFIIGYMLYIAEMYRNEWEVLIEQQPTLKNVKLPEWEVQRAKAIVSHINAVNTLRLKRSRKYLFTPSAITLHTQIMPHHRDGSMQQPIERHLWVECEHEQATPYGNVRALFLSQSYPIAEIGIVAKNDSKLSQHLHNTYITHKGYLGLEVITSEYDTMFDFTYDTASSQWVFLPSHKCPKGLCKYPDASTVMDVMAYERLQVCEPCEYCIEACGYFARWFVSALAMIEGVYSLTPDDTIFNVVTREYTSKETTTIGKGKNSRKIATEVKRNVEYTLITYDATMAHRPLTEDEQETIQETGTNWLLTTPEGDIVWVRRTIKAYRRKYPTRKNGTRQEGEVIIKNDFIKRVPMLRTPNKPTIIKVVARRTER